MSCNSCDKSVEVLKSFQQFQKTFKRPDKISTIPNNNNNIINENIDENKLTSQEEIDKLIPLLNSKGSFLKYIKPIRIIKN